MKLLFKIITIISLIFTSIFAASYQEEAKNIRKTFDEAISLYESGDNAKARAMVQTAYFSHFEYLEAGIRINLGQKKSYEMEKQFGDIRKAIKNEQSIDEIKSMIDKLNSEISEILPIIENGHKLVAEKSSDGGISAAGLSTQTTETQTAQKDIISNPWQDLYLQISKELNNAKISYEKQNVQGIKDALNKAKFELYRNQKLEIAIRRYVSSQSDQMIQQIIGNVISENINMEAKKFEQSIKDVDDLLKTAILNLPSESYAFAPVIQTQQNEEKSDFNVVVENIKVKMANVLKSYENGDKDSAISDASDIYFDEYEASGMEAIVGAKNSQLKLDTEASFSKIVSLMQKNADVSQIKAAQNELFSQLEASVEFGKNSSGLELLFYAFIIILREGFEALIIITAIIAYLVKTGNKSHLSIVYSAVLVAIVLSFVTAWALSAILGSQMAAQSREILEGVVMLIAVLLLYYVGFWLLNNANSKKWNAYIKDQVSTSLSNKDSKTLWWVVFLAVYREGAETVLFYLALILDAKNSTDLAMIGSGFGLGVVGLGIIYILMKYFSLKIPIRAFFILTSIIIFYMAIAFVGKGVMELVEGKVFVPTLLQGVPTIPWLGIYPYAQSLIPQILMLLSLIIAIFIMKKKF